METQMPYQLDDEEAQVLDVLKDEYRANPYRIREVTGLRKQYVNDALTQLQKAECIRQVTRGLYEFVKDPRSDSEGARPSSTDHVQELETEMENLRDERDRLRERVNELKERDDGNIDGHEIRRLVDDLEAACERGDRNAVQDALDRLREVADNA